jgi:hypothetical protein
MENEWWCVSCVTDIELDTHGRCSTCGSDAVDRIARSMTARPGDAVSTRADRTGHEELVALVLGWTGSTIAATVGHNGLSALNPKLKTT